LVVANNEQAMQEGACVSMGQKIYSSNIPERDSAAAARLRTVGVPARRALLSRLAMDRNDPS